MNLAELFKQKAQDKSTLAQLPYTPAKSPTYEDLPPELREVYDLFKLITHAQGSVSDEDKYQFAHCLYSSVNVYIGLYDLRPMGGNTANFSVCMYDKDGRIYDADKTLPDNIRFKVDAEIKNNDGYMERIIDGENFISIKDVLEEAVKWAGGLCAPNSPKAERIHKALQRKQASMKP